MHGVQSSNEAVLCQMKSHLMYLQMLNLLSGLWELPPPPPHQMQEMLIPFHNLA